MATIPRCSVYNGTVLPNAPDFDTTVYSNWLIADQGNNEYVWLASNNAFVFANMVAYGEAYSLAIHKDSQVLGFIANPSTCEWEKATLTFQQANENGRLTCIPFSYVWSLYPIYYDGSTTVAYEAGAVVTPWDVEEPTITALTGAGTTENPTGYWQGDAARPLVCEAAVSDGGTLTYKWYREDGSLVGAGSSYIPFTSTAGSFLYQCTVTNTRTADSGFSDFDTVQSDIMAIVVTAKEDDGDDTEVTTRKPVGIMGYVLRMCGVPMAELIAEKLCMGVGEDADAGTGLYLYGSPSESGNIGLRSGNTVTYYKGAALPNINTVYTDDLKLHFPHAFIQLLSTGEYRFRATVDPAYIVWVGYTYNEERVNTDTASNLQFAGSDTQNGGTSWEVIEVPEYGASGHAIWCTTDAFIWCNHDIYYPDDYSHDAALAGTIKFAATDPIPVGEIVDTIDGIPIYEVKT